jgi:hypothetical protein
MKEREKNRHVKLIKRRGKREAEIEMEEEKDDRWKEKVGIRSRHIPYFAGPF